MKMKKFALVLVLFLIPSLSFAADKDKWFSPMSKGEIAAEVLWQGLNQIDWAQTRDITKNYSERDKEGFTPDPNKVNPPGGGFTEMNPLPAMIFGKERGYGSNKYPSKDAVNKYFIATSLIHPLITKLLPPKYRKYWLGVSISVTGGFVYHNEKIGLRIDFRRRKQ